MTSIRRPNENREPLSRQDIMRELHGFHLPDGTCLAGTIISYSPPAPALQSRLEEARREMDAATVPEVKSRLLFVFQMEKRAVEGWEERYSFRLGRHSPYGVLAWSREAEPAWWDEYDREAGVLGLPRWQSRPMSEAIAYLPELTCHAEYAVPGNGSAADRVTLSPPSADPLPVIGASPMASIQHLAAWLRTPPAFQQVEETQDGVVGVHTDGEGNLHRWTFDRFLRPVEIVACPPGSEVFNVRVRLSEYGDNGDALLPRRIAEEHHQGNGRYLTTVTTIEQVEPIGDAEMLRRIIPAQAGTRLCDSRFSPPLSITLEEDVLPSEEALRELHARQKELRERSRGCLERFFP